MDRRPALDTVGNPTHRSHHTQVPRPTTAATPTLPRHLVLPRRRPILSLRINPLQKLLRTSVGPTRRLNRTRVAPLRRQVTTVPLLLLERVTNNILHLRLTQLRRSPIRHRNPLDNLTVSPNILANHRHSLLLRFRRRLRLNPWKRSR